VVELLEEVGIPLGRRRRAPHARVDCPGDPVVTFGCLDSCPIGAKDKAEDWPTPGATGKSMDQLRGSATSCSVESRLWHLASRGLRKPRRRGSRKLEGAFAFPRPLRPVLLTHCGAGSDDSVKDAAELAGSKGLSVLHKGGSALEAVIEAIVVLEDDPRLNAGTGSRMRIDGRSRWMRP